LAVAGGDGVGCVGSGGVAGEGLEPGRGRAVGGVDTGGSHVVTVADLVGAVDVAIVGNGIVGASYLIVDVIAEQSGIGIGWVAELGTEHVVSDELNPFDNLCPGRGIVLLTLHPGGEGGCRVTKAAAEHDTTEGVSLFIITMRIKFTTEVSGIQVEVCLIDITNDLDVVLCVQPLQTSESSLRD